MKLINKLVNFTYKSFSDYSGPEGNFNKKNLIFGYNGRGKSSLSKGIVEEFLKNSENTVENYRLFNREYIFEEMSLEPSGKDIKGVKVIFGKKQKDLISEIEEERAKIVDTEPKEVELKALEKTIREQIDRIFNNHKGNLNIRNKINVYSKESFDVDDLIRRYKQDYDRALQLEPDLEKLKTYKGDDSIAEEFREVDNYRIPQIELYSIADVIENINKIMSTEYLEEQLPTRELLEWLEEGIDIHKEDHDNCKFCGNRIMQYEDIVLRITSYSDNKKQKDWNYLDEVKKKLERNNTDFDSIINDENKLILLIPEEKNQIKDIISSIRNCKEINQQNIIKIKEKLDDFTNESKNYLESSYLIHEEINKLNELYLTKKESSSNKYHNQEDIVKGAIALNVINDSFIESVVGNINLIKNEIIDVKSKNQVINQNIQAMEEKNQDSAEYKDFMIYMNEILENFTLDFKLVFNEDKLSYNLVHKNHTEKLPINLTLKDISEGEKNLFALLYFYYGLYKDNNQVNLDEKIKLIIIDDAISSLDAQNRFSVLEILRTIANEQYPQIFIFTHVWDDFCQLSYHLNKKEDTSLFEVLKRDNGESYVISEKNPINPYNLLFKEVSDASLITRNQEVDERYLAHIPNAMRRVFEEFLSFKSSGRVYAQYSNMDKILQMYKQATGLETVSGSKKRKLAALLDMINILSHVPIKCNEIPENARFLLSLIEDMDKVHFDYMKANICSL